MLKQGNHYALVGIPNEHGFAYVIFYYAIWYSFKEKVSFKGFKVSLTQRAWIDYLLNRTGQEKKNKTYSDYRMWGFRLKDCRDISSNRRK